MATSGIREYCKKYASLIFVLEQMDGKWDAYSLDQLSEEVKEKHIARWEAEGHPPVRMRAADNTTRT